MRGWRLGEEAFSLFPVLRGEGGGEGLVARGVELRSPAQPSVLVRTGAFRLRAQPPLSPTLSPEYREEGVSESTRDQRAEELDHWIAREPGGQRDCAGRGGAEPGEGVFDGGIEAGGGAGDE